MGGGSPQNQVTTTATKNKGTEDTASTNFSNATTSGGGTSLTGATQYGQQDVSIPDWLKNFVGQSTGVAGTSLGAASGLAGGYQIPPEALQALSQTAGGDFLYGGPGQQPFIDAAVRGASPGIFSQFGAAGGGGGGLQKAALDQAAVDAYAKLYQGERTNQLSAATALPGITQMPFNMQAQLAQLAGGLPGQFAPFLGQMSSGGSFGFGDTTQYGQSATTGGGTQHGVTTGSGTSTETKPLYETPWWQTALGAVGAGAGLLGSMNPAIGMGKAIAGAGVPLISPFVGSIRGG